MQGHTKRFVVMGAGEVGCHLARTLSLEGHEVSLIDKDAAKRQRVEEALDVGFVLGDATHVPTLEEAGAGSCDVFVAATVSDEANLVAALLAKQIGAPRTVVRLATSEDVVNYGSVYERTFRADLLLSTPLLTRTRILNHVLGLNTIEVEYLARGALQVRRTQIEAGSVLHERRLADAGLPDDCLVLAYLSGGRLVVPTGDDRAQAGDEALLVGTSTVIDEVERMISGHSRTLGLVVIAGGGATAHAVAKGLEGQADSVKLIETDRARAEELAATFPDFDIVQGDAIDMATLAAEGVGRAEAFIALTGNDETNLMACLLAQELGAKRMTALVQKSETSTLWRKVGLLDVVSPRVIAAERIHNFIDANYESSIVSLENGAAQFVQRRVLEHSAVAGETLADIEIPQGLIVAAVVRRGRAVIPGGKYRLEVGDDVILFVRVDEAGTVQLLFPGIDGD